MKYIETAGCLTVETLGPHKVFIYIAIQGHFPFYLSMSRLWLRLLTFVFIFKFDLLYVMSDAISCIKTCIIEDHLLK